MKKANLLVILLLTVAGVFAQASNDDCPLKNLKKNQLRSDTSTAFFPNHRKSANPIENLLGDQVLRNN